MQQPVVKGAQFFLAHTPGLVRHGSKPLREIAHDPALLPRLRAHLRTYSDAVAYAPHQVLLGNLRPDELASLPAPWYANLLGEAPAAGPHGNLVDEVQFLGLLRAADDFKLLQLEDSAAAAARAALQGYSLVTPGDLAKVQGQPESSIAARLQRSGALPLELRDGTVAGFVQTDYEEDASLAPEILLENLAVKATASLALRSVLQATGTDPASIDYVIGSGEEAIGDRY